MKIKCYFSLKNFHFNEEENRLQLDGYLFFKNKNISESISILIDDPTEIDQFMNLIDRDRFSGLIVTNLLYANRQKLKKTYFAENLVIL